jgi:IS5 family transposase
LRRGRRSKADCHLTPIPATVYNLSDENTELQIRDRISFRIFLGLDMGDTIPDAKTIWLFAERLKQLGLEPVCVC